MRFLIHAGGTDIEPTHGQPLPNRGWQLVEVAAHPLPALAGDQAFNLMAFFAAAPDIRCPVAVELLTATQAFKPTGSDTLLLFHRCFFCFQIFEIKKPADVLFILRQKFIISRLHRRGARFQTYFKYIYR